MRVADFTAFQNLECARALRVAEFEELLDAIGMATPVERRFKVDFEHSFDHLPAGEPLRKCDHVGVVVAACELRRIRLGDRGASYAWYFIRCHCDTQTRAADQYAAVGLTGGDGLSDCVAVLRIIDRRCVVRSEVEYLIAAIAQQLRDAIFVSKAGVIGAKGNFHLFYETIQSEGGWRCAVERSTPMKLACASGSLHRDIESGELTQLEFLDLCAHDLACDGVVLDVRHFPRSDDDYLAQVKKMATDRGLSIAALADPAFFSVTRKQMADVLDRAVTLGAPLVAGPLSREIDGSWTEQLARLGVATSLAKARNVTLALRNAAATFAASTTTASELQKKQIRPGCASVRNPCDSMRRAILECWSRTPSCSGAMQAFRVSARSQKLLRCLPAFAGISQSTIRPARRRLPKLAEAIRRWRNARARTELGA